MEERFSLSAILKRPLTM